MSKKKPSALRHQSGISCGLCDAKLAQVHDDLGAWFRAAKLKWQNMHISWGFRDQLAQDRAFKDGASFLVWPHSAHNYMIGTRPCALALDIFQIDEDGIARFEYLFNKTLWEWTTRDYGSKSLLWGGHFKKLGDSGHFELRPEQAALEMH